MIDRFRRFYKNTESKTKKAKDRLVLFLVKFLDFLNIRPFFVSLMSLFFGLFAIYPLVHGKNFLFLLMMLLKTLFDGLDGALVRYKGKKYGQGFWLDYGFDRTVAVAILATVFILQGKAVFYFLPLLSYVLVHSIYIFNKKKLIVVYADAPYYILLAFNKFYASFFGVTLNILNLLLFFFYFAVFTSRKKQT